MMETPKNLLRALDMVTAPEEPRAEALGTVRAAHMQRVRTIFDDPNIVAVGISEKVSERKPTGELSLCFYVEKKISKRKLGAAKLIPPVVAVPDGSAVFTDVKQIGKLLPQANIRKSPIRSGYSVGHRSITAGTLGAIVKKGRKYFLLSNSHVLALSGKGKIGDKVVYPGPDDGGKLPADLVATLSAFVPFQVGGDFVNRVDAALAEIVEKRHDDLDFSILDAKKALATIAPARGMTVAKRGRTTGDTESTVEDVNFRAIIEYDDVGKVGFLDQAFCRRYTGPGDSGAIVVDKKSGKIVGLHFAGASGGSVFNPIGPVMTALKFKFASA
jgi:hypothetical protein